MRDGERTADPARESAVADRFLQFVTGRSSLAALLFSAAVHAAVFVAWPSLSPDGEKLRRPVMVARLLPVPSGRPPVGSGGKAAEKREPAVEKRNTRAEVPGEKVPEGDLTGAARAGSVGGLAGVKALGVIERSRQGDRLNVVAGGGGGHPSSTAAPAVARLSSPSVAAQVEEERTSVQEMLSEIRRRIESRKSYPRLARRNGWEGIVLVELNLEGDGALRAVRVIEPSAHSLLDQATLAAVRRAGPFPPLPGRVRVPVSYSLSGR